MGFDKRSVPGPGHYQPRRKNDGGACNVGESQGAYSVTAHGFSLGGGVSRDYSISDYAQGGPWLTYPRFSTVSKKLQEKEGTYLMASAFGPQSDSTKSSAPRPNFGKGPQIAPTRGAQTPGPQEYATVGSIGDQPTSTKGNAPHFSIGAKLPSEAQGPDTPGPQYNAHEAFATGGYLDTSHRAVVGKASRSASGGGSAKSNPNIGPGMYGTTVSTGEQISSMKATNPAYAFPKQKTYRDKDSVKGDPVFVSKKHVQDKFGRDGPGPLGYKVSMTYKGITLLSGKGGRGVSFTKGAKDARPASTDGTPGPNSYKVRQSMGSQVLSTTPSAGAVPKSTMERSQWSKAYISSSHTKFDSGIDSPGPAYLPETNARGGDTLSLGRTKKNGWSFPKQPQRPSTVASMRSPGPGTYRLKSDFDPPVPRQAKGTLEEDGVSATFNFSKELRACLKEFDDISPRGDLYFSREAAESQTLGVDAPGPGSYTVQSSIGGGNPVVHKDPSWKFGTSQRRPATVNVGSGDLGPGDYQVRSSIGAQSESKRRSGPSYTQPRSERDVESTKVYSGMNKPGSGSGATGPGPQHYQTLWKTSSKKKRSPSFGFGTEARSSSFLYS